MSTLVEQINDSITSLIATELGATYSELEYVLDVSQNAFDLTNKKYGVRPLFANSVEGVTKVYTLDQDFEIILTDEFVNSGVDDTAQREVAFSLYDKMSEIFKAIYLTKAGVPSIVLIVNSITMSEPEYLTDEVAILRAIVRIKYREAIN